MLLHWCKSALSFARMRELRICIQPNHVVLTLLVRTYKTGFRWQLLHRQVLALSHPEDGLVADEKLNGFANLNEKLNGFAPLGEKLNGFSRTHFLIEALQQALQTATWQRLIGKNTVTKVMLSNHFVRYITLPWRADISSAAEQNAYMRHRFTLAFGERAASLNMRMSPPAFKKTAFASGIDNEMIDAVSTVCQRCHLHLVGVYPQLMAAVNHAMQETKTTQAAPFWLVVFEATQLSLLLIAQGEICMVKNGALEKNALQQIHTLIARAAILYQTQHTFDDADNNLLEIEALNIVLYDAPFDAQALVNTKELAQIKQPITALASSASPTAFWGFRVTSHTDALMTRPLKLAKTTRKNTWVTA